MPTLAEVFVGVRPDTDGFEADLRSQLGGVDAAPAGQKAGSGFASGFGKTIRNVVGLAAAGLAAAGAKKFVDDSIAQASDLSEAINVTSLTFKEEAASLEGFFKGSASAIGLSEVAARSAASNVGGLLNNLGYTRTESAATSKSILTLGADLGSAFNKDPAQAVEAIGAALRGEAEPIRAFNVTLSDAALKAKALELGLYSGKGALDANAKAQATLALITQQTADVQGDFANTAEGLANKQRAAAAGTDNLRAVIGAGLLPIVTSLTAAYADKLLPALTDFAVSKTPAVQAGFDKVTTGAQGLYDLLITGDFSGKLATAFGWQEDSGTVDALFRIRDAAGGLWELFANRDFNGQLTAAFGWEEDSAIVDFLFDLRDAATGLDLSGIAEQVRSFLTTGENSTLPDTFASIGDSVLRLIPVAQEFITQMPGVADVLNVGATGLGFFADHADTLITLMPLLVAAFVAVKVAQVAANVAMAASPVIRLLEVSATRAQTAAVRELAAAHATSTVAQVTNTGATNVGMLTRLRATASLIASSIAQRAVAAATTVMTGAQWLLNAAMSANPIGRVVVAIAALVGGLIYAYQNSETFRNVVNAAFTTVENVVGGVVDWLRTAVPAAIEFVLQAFLRYTPVGLVIGHWGEIWAFIGSAVDWLKSAPPAAIQSLLQAFLRYTPVGIVISHWSEIRDFVVGAATGLKDKAVAAFEQLQSGAKSKVSGLLDDVRGLPDRITSGLGNLDDLLVEKGKDVVRGLASGITAMKGYLLDKARSILGPLADLLPGSPVKAGPLRVLNNGYAGGQIARMIADGYTAKGDLVASALRSSLSVPALSAPQLRLPRPQVAGPRPGQTAAVGTSAAGGSAAAPAGVSVSLTQHVQAGLDERAWRRNGVAAFNEIAHAIAGELVDV